MHDCYVRLCRWPPGQDKEDTYNLDNYQVVGTLTGKGNAIAEVCIEGIDPGSSCVGVPNVIDLAQEIDIATCPNGLSSQYGEELCQALWGEASNFAVTSTAECQKMVDASNIQLTYNIGSC